MDWLAGKKDDIKKEDKEKLQSLKQYWNSSKLPQSERFLRDFILNKGYVLKVFLNKESHTFSKTQIAETV